MEENLSPILRLVMSEFQARPGCILQGWRPQVMCSLRGGEGSVGTYLTLAQPVSQAPWTLSSPVEGLWPLPWVTACALQREEMAGVSLGAYSRAQPRCGFTPGLSVPICEMGTAVPTYGNV